MTTVINLFGPSGSGKAQPLDSKILTDSGWKNMGDISLTDKVYTKSGNLTNILKITPQGIKHIFKVNFKDGRSTKCCEDHLWEIHSTRSQKLHTSVLDTKSLIPLLSKNNPIQIPITPINFMEKLLPIEPYLLGVLIGDGSLISQVRFTSYDKEITESIESIVNGNKLYSNLSVKPVGKDLSKYFYSISKDNYKPKELNYLWEKIKELNLNCKSEFKFIPDIYKHTSINQRLELLQGLFDTDGTVSKNTNSVTYSTSSFQLALDVQYIIRSLGCKSKILNKKTKCLPSYIVTISGKFKDQIFKLTRKKNLISIGQYDTSYLSIESIEYVGEEYCQCIQVEDSSRLYITDDFILTHNSTTALGLAYELKLKGYKVEVVTEWIKEKIFANDLSVVKDQLYIFAKQRRKQFILQDKGLDFIVTDSPLLLSGFYGIKYNTTDKLMETVIFNEFHKFSNLNFLLKRTIPFDPTFRLESQQQSDTDYVNMQNFLEANSVEYLDIDESEKTQQILKLLNLGNK